VCAGPSGVTVLAVILEARKCAWPQWVAGARSNSVRTARSFFVQLDAKPASVATLSHGTSCTPPPSAASGRRREQDPARCWFFDPFVPDGVVPQHLAGAAFHHLRADIERREQQIEGRIS
jgi:hypothetical protein